MSYLSPSVFRYPRPRESRDIFLASDWLSGSARKETRRENSTGSILEMAGRRFYRLHLYTVIILHTQLNTAQLYMVTTRHRTTLHVHNSIQHNSAHHNSTRLNSTRHNSTRHNSTRPQLDTPQLYTATTRNATTVHRPHGRKAEATIE